MKAKQFKITCLLSLSIVCITLIGALIISPEKLIEEISAVERTTSLLPFTVMAIAGIGCLIVYYVKDKLLNMK